MTAEVTYPGMTGFSMGCDRAEIGTFYQSLAALFSN